MYKPTIQDIFYFIFMFQSSIIFWKTISIFTKYLCFSGRFIYVIGLSFVGIDGCAYLYIYIYRER